MIPFLGFFGGSYEHRHSVLGMERCVNWIPEPQPVGGKFDRGYVTRPGLQVATTAGVGPRRADFEQNGRTFVVSGPTLYELSLSGSAWTATSRGTVGTDGKPASIAGNGDQGDQLLVISAGSGYIFTLSTNSLSAAISDPQFPTFAVQAVFWRGHFVAIGRNGTTFHLSTNLDGTGWATADIGERAWSSDYIQAVVADEDSGELFLKGKQKTEVWWYNGALGFPAEPVNKVIPYGTPSTFAWAQLGEGVYGLATSRRGGRFVGRYLSGYSIERVSHPALDSMLESYTTAQIDNAEAVAFEWRGHRFFKLTIDDDVTWIYDETTNLWHRWDYWEPTQGVSQAFLGMGHVSIGGKHIMGSRRDGTIYEFTTDYHYDNASDVIRIERIAPYVHANHMRVPHNAIAFDFQVGVGNGDAAAPVAMLQYSDTNGATWSTERTIALGALGNVDQECKLSQLGTSPRKGRLYKMVITDPVVRGLAGAYLDLGAAA